MHAEAALKQKRKLARLITQYRDLLSNCASQSTNNAQDEYKFCTPEDRLDRFVSCWPIS